jgi:hypothetical protein
MAHGDTDQPISMPGERPLIGMTGRSPVGFAHTDRSALRDRDRMLRGVTVLNQADLPRCLANRQRVLPNG